MLLVPTSGLRDTARMNNELETLSTDLGCRLTDAGLILTTAESCTGGWIAKCVTDVAGSSAWFDRGLVVYSNAAKHELLGVATETLDLHGAVSEAVVQEMALGALRNGNAQVSVAVSGIAGPGGGSVDKPVGTLCSVLHYQDSWSPKPYISTAIAMRYAGKALPMHCVD